MDIYDCFPFNDEVNILKTRITYLEPVVRYFVIAESNQTFSGIPKNYYADEVIDGSGIDKSRFIRVKYKFPESLIRTARESGNRWPLERFARNSLSQVIQEMDPGNCVILSDVDEIPSKDQIIKAANLPILTRVSTPEYYGKANWKKRGADPWLTVKIGPSQYFTDLNQVRYSVVPITHGVEGAHFSDMYTEVQEIKRKAKSSAHSEFDLPDETLQAISIYANQYKVDHRGRFFRKGMGLVNVTQVLNEQQKLLASFAPELLDNTFTPSYFRRVCASYNLSRAWSGDPDQLKERANIVWFGLAVSHHSFWKLSSFLRKAKKKIVRFWQNF